MLRSRPIAARARRAAVCAAVAALLAGAVTVWVVVRPLGSSRLTSLAQSSPRGSGAHAEPATTTSSSFRLAVIRHYGLPANASGYSVILTTGPSQAWAFGGTNPGGPSAPVATWWDGDISATATLPGGLTSFFKS